jgi:hypothetical protein
LEGQEPEDQGSGLVIANNLGDHTSKILTAMLTGSVFQGAEHLLYKNDTLSSNLNLFPTSQNKSSGRIICV